MKNFIHYGSTKATRLILYGSLGVAVVLTLLLLVYDIWIASELRIRTVVGAIIILYLIIAIFYLGKGMTRMVSWMLVCLYACLAFTTLLYWGLNSAVGIFATSFVIVMSGFLLGSRSILPVTFVVIVVLICVQTIHSLEIVQPDLTAMSVESNFLDVISYSTILGVFSLITWISSSQIEKNLKRAQEAEKSIRAQKNNLANELEKESTRLRELKLNEIKQLYKFAALGQSTAATLHELSNHLSVLNLDIVDLKQQNINSEAIKNAEDGIEQINKMVRHARRQLNSYDLKKTFNANTAINRSIKDLQEKFNFRHVKLIKSQSSSSQSFTTRGNPLALMQIINILLNNALDACYESDNPQVSISIETNDTFLTIYITDNGPGIDPTMRGLLFSPIVSKKATGLGVGLYIAHSLVDSQFNGSLKLVETDVGATFKITIPKKSYTDSR